MKIHSPGTFYRVYAEVTEVTIKMEGDGVERQFWHCWGRFVCEPTCWWMSSIVDSADSEHLQSYRAIVGENLYGKDTKRIRVTICRTIQYLTCISHTGSEKNYLNEKDRVLNLFNV